MHTLKNQIVINAVCDVLSKQGDIYPLSITEEYPIEVLISLGHYHQEIICNELEKRLNQLVEEDDTLLGSMNIFFNCTINTIEDITLTGSEFIPKLRGLYGRVT